MLNNEGFMQKAPETKKQEIKDKKIKYEEQLITINARIEELKKNI